MSEPIIERTNAAVITVRFDDVAAGWEHWVLLRSDAHHDSPRCNRKLEKQHLEEMVYRQGSWADFGDLFDAMQGKFDPRRNMDELRPEDKRADYFDAIVDHAAEFYEPYATRCLMLGVGNHETAALKNANTFLTGSLAREMTTRMRPEARPVEVGCYGGWLRFVFTINKTKRQQVRVRYFHGAGAGNAPVTGGVIQTNRQAVFLPDADVVLNGHNHRSYVFPIARDRITNQGKQYQDIQWHGRIPGYLDAYGNGTDGWWVESGKTPTPQGALWLHLSHNCDRVRWKLIPEME